MDICFVMQPFDGAKFDKRYEDVFAPAIRNANIEPYRVDQDPKVSIPIQDIERGIRDSRICLAEITLDNPNVWFELGYAFASGKEVVLVCSDERTTKFPFDIQHRAIIKYSTSSSSDFDKLKHDITTKIKAYLEKTKNIDESSIFNAASLNLNKQFLRSLEEIKLALENIKHENNIEIMKESVLKKIEQNKLSTVNSFFVDGMRAQGYINLSVKILIGLPLSAEELNEIVDGQPYLLRTSSYGNNPVLDIFNKSKQKIGTVINTFNFYYDNDENDVEYIIKGLDNVFDLNILEGTDGFIRPHLCEFEEFYDNEKKFRIRFSSEMFPRG